MSEEIPQAAINKLYEMKKERNDLARKAEWVKADDLDNEIQEFQNELIREYGEDCLKDTKLSELTAYMDISRSGGNV